MSWSAAAWAQDAPAQPSADDMARARELYQSAEARKRQADEAGVRGQSDAALVSYGLAAADYLQGYRLSRLPAFLYNLGSVYRLRGERRWAIRCYRAFLDSKPTDERDVRDTLTFIAEIRESLTRDPAEDPAEPALDPGAECPSGDESAATPKPAEPAAQPDDDATPGGVRDLGDDEPAAGSGWRIAFWGAAGVTVAAGAAGVITYMQMKDIAAEVPQGGCDLPEFKDRCEAGDRKALLSNVFQGVAVVGLAASGYLFYKGYIATAGEAAPAPQAARFTPVIGPGAVGAELVLRF